MKNRMAQKYWRFNVNNIWFGTFHSITKFCDEMLKLLVNARNLPLLTLMTKRLLKQI